MASSHSLFSVPSSSPFKKPVIISAADACHRLNLVTLTEMEGNRILAVTDREATIIYNYATEEVEYSRRNGVTKRPENFVLDNSSLNRYKRGNASRRLRYAFPVLDQQMCHISDGHLDVHSVPELVTHCYLRHDINTVDAAFPVSENRVFMYSRQDKTCLMRNIENFTVQWKFTGLPVASSNLNFIADYFHDEKVDFIIDAIKLGNGDIACLSAKNFLYVVDQVTGQYKSKMKVHQNDFSSVSILCVDDKNKLVLSNQSGTILVCDTKNNTMTTRRLLNVHIYSANVYGDMLLTLSQDGVLNIWDSSYNLLKSVQSIAQFTNFITICKNGDLLIPQQQDKSTCVIHRLPIDYILKHPAKSFDFNSIPKFQDEPTSTQQLSPKM